MYKDNIATQDQYLAFLDDVRRVEQKRVDLLKRHKLFKRLNLQEVEQLEQLNLEVAELLFQAERQGISLQPPAPPTLKDRLNQNPQARIPLLVLTTLVTALAVWLLYSVIGVIVLHLIAATLFFIVGLKLGIQFTRRCLLDAAELGRLATPRPKAKGLLD